MLDETLRELRIFYKQLPEIVTTVLRITNISDLDTECAAEAADKVLESSSSSVAATVPAQSSLLMPTQLLCAAI